MSKSARSSLKLTLMTLISRVLGLFRDHFLARFFGTGIIATYWEIAYMLPNMLRNLFAEGILSQAFVPVYSESLKVSEEKAKKDSGKIILFLSLVLSIIVFLGILSFPYLLPYYVGKPKEEIGLLILLAQILFGFIAFISLSSIFSGILYTHQKFTIPTLTPIFLNIEFIFTFLVFLVLSRWYKIDVETIAIILAIMVLLGSFLVLAFQYYFVKKYGWDPEFKFSLQIFSDPVIKKLFFLVAPAILGASIFQLNQLMDVFLASYFVNVEGAIPALRFAHRLIQLPTGLIGVAISTTILPIIASYIRNNESYEKSGEELIYAIRFSLFLTVPATIGLFILAPWIVHFLFSGGLWDLRSTFITLWALQFYVLGIPFYSTNKILTSTYYAFQDTKTPVKILIVVVVMNLILNVLFIPFFQHGGLALSTSLSAFINTVLLFLFLKKKSINIPYKELLSFVRNIVLLIFVLMVYLYFVDKLFYFPLEENRFSLSFLLTHDFKQVDVPHRIEALKVLLVGILGSLILYFTLAKIFLKKEFMVILSIFKK
ncbi:MAG: murein biosynthesis integral membrane protein MurJ [Leptospiraceae bacterium]|jgi:putative peptidoglycan lipid II flippase|nr:murein biosynthesis integral membrane protein MurJ [Leptospiraceae bacterium]